MDTEHLQDSPDLAQGWSDALAPFLSDLLMQSTLWALVLALAGLLLAIVLMSLMHRRKLLRRRPPVWNIFAKLSYLLVLAALPLAGLARGLLLGVERSLEQAVETTLEPILAEQMPALRRNLAEHIGPLATQGMLTARDLVQPIVQDLLYEPRSDSTIERFKARIINESLMRGAAQALTYAFQASMQRAADWLPATASGAGHELVTFSTDTVLRLLKGTAEQVDFSPLDKSVPDIFATAMKRQVGAFFNGIYITIGLKLLLLALIIGGEMEFYFRYYQPRHRVTAMEAA